jgi:indolepyruvate ferredoxin oxidoreductase alpha subunit
MNETIDTSGADVGIILQGGLYNGLLRSLGLLGAADVYGRSTIPLHVLNVTYPPASSARRCCRRRANTPATSCGAA